MLHKINNALAQLPEKISHYLAPIVLSDEFDATLSPAQLDALVFSSGLNSDKVKIALLPLAAAYSYAPISNFFVGAIAQGISGSLYFGANMEFLNTQLGQTVHAEQSAISHAWMKGEEGVTDITINYSPCGHCRQFINELTTAETITIQLPKKKKVPTATLR